jgi:hypothetical protein
MIITENKLRQIIRKELLNLLEGRQPMEDLAIFHKLLSQLGTFHFGGKHEEETLSFLNNEMIPTLQSLTNQIKNYKLQKQSVNEGILAKLKYYLGKEKETRYKVEKTDLQKSISNAKNELIILRKTIRDKRRYFNKEYDVFHKRDLLPVLNVLQETLEYLIGKNTKYPSRTEVTKSDILKRTEGGY